MAKIDYRYQLSENTAKKEVYFAGKNKLNKQKIQQNQRIKKISSKNKYYLFSLGAKTKLIYQDEQKIWFEMQEICIKAHSYLDYLELIQKYRAIIISKIKQSQLNNLDCLRRFIWLVDIAYDNKIQLVLAAKKNIFKMLKQSPYCHDLNRTISRLIQNELI